MFKIILLVLIDIAFIFKIIRMMKASELHCHKCNERCYKWQQDKEWRICSRCFSMYIGIFCFPLVYIITGNINIWWLGIVSIILQIPMLLDGFTQLKTSRMSNNGLRTITGFCSGVGLALIIIATIKLGGF